MVSRSISSPATVNPRVGLAAAAGILTGRPIVRPPRTQDRPNIDGRLDDAVWRNAVQVTDFVQQQPLEGAPATEETDVFIAYDSQNIYFAFHAHYSDPSIMRANRVDRDQAFRDDKISVYFDPFLDQQRAYSFSVNGYGVQGDALMNARAAAAAAAAGDAVVAARGGRGGGGGGARVQPTRNSLWRQLVGRPVRQRRRDRRRRFHRRDGDPLQEPSVSAARLGDAAPMGLSDRPRDPRQGRECRLGADLAGGVRLPDADGPARRHDQPVDEPQPRVPADLHRHSVRLDRQLDR